MSNHNSALNLSQEQVNATGRSRDIYGQMAIAKALISKFQV